MPLPEVLPQPNRLAGLVGKERIEGKLLPELLVDPDVAEHRRPRRVRREDVRGREEHPCGKKENRTPCHPELSEGSAPERSHRFGSPVAGVGSAAPGTGMGGFAAMGLEGGRPRSTTISIARSTGI